MMERKDIPDAAICPKCGQPMQVVILRPQAAKLGFKVREGAFVIGCCGYELTIDDDAAAESLRDLLLAYHTQEKRAIQE